MTQFDKSITTTPQQIAKYFHLAHFCAKFRDFLMPKRLKKKLASSEYMV
jgi:hypothetical protein